MDWQATLMASDQLPRRKGPRPPTSKNMPHAQIGVRPVAAVNEELFRRCFSLPDVRNEPTVISIPGARALWLDEDLPLAHPEVIVRGREFAHIHPDGSLHASLAPERAREAADAGWAEHAMLDCRLRRFPDGRGTNRTAARENCGLAECCRAEQLPMTVFRMPNTSSPGPN